MRAGCIPSARVAENILICRTWSGECQIAEARSLNVGGGGSSEAFGGSSKGLAASIESTNVEKPSLHVSVLDDTTSGSSSYRHNCSLDVSTQLQLNSSPSKDIMVEIEDDGSHGPLVTKPFKFVTGMLDAPPLPKDSSILTHVCSWYVRRPCLQLLARPTSFPMTPFAYNPLTSRCRLRRALPESEPVRGPPISQMPSPAKVPGLI